MQGLLPRKLRMLRAERGLTLRQVESLTGVSKETLSGLERGKQRPHDVTLAKLAEGYGISLEELFDLAERLLEAEGSEATAGAGKVEAPEEAGPQAPLAFRATTIKGRPERIEEVLRDMVRRARRGDDEDDALVLEAMQRLHELVEA